MTSAKTKITYIIDNLRVGGAQRHLCRLIVGLNTHFDVRVISMGTIADCLKEELDGVTLQVVSMQSIKTGAFWKGFAQLVKVLKHNQSDIVHTYLNTANVFGVLAARMAKTPCIISSRRDMGHFQSKFMARLEKWANRFVHKIVCVSQAVKEQSMKKEGFPDEKAVVLYTGIDEQKFQRTTKMTIDTDHFLIGMVATMDREVKGHRYFLEAAFHILTKRQDVRFMLIGDGKLRADLEKQVQDKGCGQFFDFKGNCSDVVKEIEAFHMGVLPSTSEGFSNAVLEALSMNVPVVAFAIEGNLEIIEHQKNGFLVQPFDTKEMANFILQMLDKPDQIMALGKNGRQTVQQHFTNQHMVDRFKEFYECCKK